MHVCFYVQYCVNLHAAEAGCVYEQSVGEMAWQQFEPADIHTGFLASLAGCCPSQRFGGGPAKGGGTPFAWLNIPVCSSSGDETFASLIRGLMDTGSMAKVEKAKAVKWNDFSYIKRFTGLLPLKILFVLYPVQLKVKSWKG